MSDAWVSRNDPGPNIGVLEVSTDADEYGDAGRVDILHVCEVEQDEGRLLFDDVFDDPRYGQPRPGNDKAGSVTLRHNSRLHHIGIGRTHAGTCVILLVQDLQIRVINAATGELLRELILDPTRDYQPTRTPKGPTKRPTK